MQSAILMFVRVRFFCKIKMKTQCQPLYVHREVVRALRSEAGLEEAVGLQGGGGDRHRQEAQATDQQHAERRPAQVRAVDMVTPT